MHEGAVRAELERLVTSAELQGSDRLCRFLRYVVEARLEGEQDKLREFLIGREVFDRNGDYDPRIDPIVRVEARRLRKKLEEFYGRESPGAVRIELPKGGYVPEFVEGVPEVAALPPATAGTRRRWLIPLVWAASLAEVGCLVYAWRAKHPAEAAQGVAVLPARWIWPGEDFPDIRHDEDLAERIGQKLSGDAKLRVIAWPVMQGYRGTTKKLRQVATELQVARVLVTAVRVESDGFRVTTYVIDAAADRKMSVRDDRSVPLQTPQDRERAAAAIAADLASRLY